MKDLSLHPCFNEEAKHTQARVHLPVAPKCNINAIIAIAYTIVAMKAARE